MVTITWGDTERYVPDRYVKLVDVNGNVIDTTYPLPVSIEESSSSVLTATTSTSVTLASASTTILSANNDRKMVILVNDSSYTQYVSCSSSASLNKGIRLNAGGGTLILETKDNYNGIITGIVFPGGQNITVTEFENQ